MKDDAPFILECPGCQTRYEIPVAIPDGGRKVRCAKCSEVWTAQPGDEIRISDIREFGEEQQDVEVVFSENAEETEPEAPPDADAEFAVEVEPEPEPESAPEPDPEYAPEPDPETAPEPEPESDLELDAEIAAAMAAEPEVAVDEAGDSDEAQPDDEEPDSVAEFYGDDSAPDDPEPEPASDPGDEAAAEGDLAAEPEVEVASDVEFPDDEDAGSDGAPQKIVVGKARRRARAPTGALGVAAGWGMLCLALFAVGYLSVNRRVAVVRALPGTAWVYESIGLPVNVRGLDFRSVDYTWETELGRVVLQVHGDIVNVTGKKLDVPNVIFALRDENDKEVYQWEDGVLSEPLPGGGHATFAIRIPTPPKSIKSVQVRFAKAR